MRAIIVQHEEHEGAGWLGPALEHAGFALVPRFRRVEPADEGAELVVVMGGAMSAFDPLRFLDDEVALLATRLARGAPCLGVCLGAQLLARAAGAEVFRGARGPEIGAAPIRWTKAGLADPVTGGGASTLVVAHWHQDTFTPVPGATLLASTACYEQQAFSLRASYGFQFHVELSTPQFEQWLTAGRDELAACGVDGTVALEAARGLAASEAERRALVSRVAAHFARAVHEAR
ncbi:MAG TPA: type 1 glutamine amidotransferase [Planctomycetota bacterium]